ncbi:MAG: DUF234 domain-containing protein [Epsilonproteobacteria bacterium]|nr:DUF234 domain-containing protein [Campylobacterota bacterium]
MNEINLSGDFNQIIQNEIINKIEILKKYFIYDENRENQQLIQKILTRLSRGDRKNYKVYSKENLSQIKGRVLFKHLFNIGAIRKEMSREKPFRTIKNQPLKKSLRRYKIEDKIHFNNNFTRFWFFFIAPYIQKNQNITFELIQPFLDKYISLEFEKLSNLLVIEKYKDEKILSYGSYWDKDIEIDLLIKTSKRTIAGEAKWKNSKICKNVFNSLQNKCRISKLDIDTFALFSKSSFSKELKSTKFSNIDLYELNDFQLLLL